MNKNIFIDGIEIILEPGITIQPCPQLSILQVKLIVKMFIIFFKIF